MDHDAIGCIAGQRRLHAGGVTVRESGPNRRRQLMERFGSLAGVKSASVAELATVPGFSTRLAERVLTHLNSAK